MKSSNQKSNFNFDDITRCPKCNLICLISLISGDIISINYSCENNHQGKIELKDYLDKQYRYYSISKELCDDCGICQKDKDGEFMYCSNCKKFLCHDCIKKHKGHERFSIDKYDSLCKKHSNFFSSYCNNCKINLCPYCIDEHKNHKIINLTKLKYSEDTKIKLKNDFDNYKKETDNLKDILKEIISLFHNTLEQIELKSNLVSLLLNTYEYNESKNNLNFYTYQNLDVCVKQFELDKTKLSDFIEDLNTFYQNLKKTIEKYNKQPFEKQNNINDKKFANINKNNQIKNQTEINEKNNNLQNIQENFDKNEINNNHYNKKKTFEKKSDENNDYLNYHIKNDYNFDDKPFFEEKNNHPISEESNKDKFKETNINQNQKINLNNEIKIQPNRKQSCETLINKQIKNENITNLYNFNCQFKNNGNYEFNKLINFKPKISFLIKNIGNIDWKENEIFLKTNKNSQLKFNDYKLLPLNKGEKQKISLTMPSINKFKDGQYNIILDFCANNQIYGESIKFKVKILQDENILVKIIDFRRNFELDEKEFPNEKVLEALKRNNFDYDKTFAFIFNN